MIRPNIVVRYSAQSLKTLPAGVLSAWGTRRVYRRKWTAYLVGEPTDKVGTFFRLDNKEWQVKETVVFESKRDLNAWIRENKPTILDQEAV